jgi:hypothetical protein
MSVQYLSRRLTSSSAKDSDGHTTAGRHGGIITFFFKLCSLSPSPLSTNCDSMRRNPFNEMFLTTFLPTFSSRSSNRCASADDVPAMSTNGSLGSSIQKMNVVDKPATMLYADGVKK